MSAQALIRGKIAQAVDILQETPLNGDPTLAFLVPGDLTWHSALILTHTDEAIRIGQTEPQIAKYMRHEAPERRLDLAWDQSSCPSVFTAPENAGAPCAPTCRRVACDEH